jgi:hypothetical protein
VLRLEELAHAPFAVFAADAAGLEPAERRIRTEGAAAVDEASRLAWANSS